LILSISKIKEKTSFGSGVTIKLLSLAIFIHHSLALSLSSSDTKYSSKITKDETKKA